MTAVFEETEALETAVCKGARGCSSAGSDPGALGNRDPPKAGFLPLDRDLSSSEKDR